MMKLLWILLLVTLTFADKLITVEAAKADGYAYGVEYIYKRDYLTGLGLGFRKYETGTVIAPILVGYPGNLMMMVGPGVFIDDEVSFALNLRVGYRFGKSWLRIVPNVSAYLGSIVYDVGAGIQLEFRAY